MAKDKRENSRRHSDIRRALALPHEDAEVYISDLIQSLYSCAMEWPEDTEVLDLDPREIEADDDYKDYFASIRSFTPDSRNEGSYLFDETSDWEHEDSAEIDDDFLFLEEKVQEARHALAIREIDDLLDAIEAIMDGFRFNVIPDLSGLTNLDNWTGVLDRPSLAGDEERRQDDKMSAAVALAVRTLAERLCELIARDPVALRHVEWRHLEYVVATALEAIGFRVQLTPPAKDGGKDVVAVCKLHGHELVFYVEVKHWRSGKRVNSKVVFDFVEVNVLDRTDGGLFISSSGFTESVYSQLAEIGRERIRLGNDLKVVSLCQHFVRKRAGIWQPLGDLPTVLFEESLDN